VTKEFVDNFHVVWIVPKAVRELLSQSLIELSKHQLESMNKILVCEKLEVKGELEFYKDDD
jgi:hypothetical protein